MASLLGVRLAGGKDMAKMRESLVTGVGVGGDQPGGAVIANYL